jgi:hypothetical protein
MEREHIVKDIRWEAMMLDGGHRELKDALNGAELPKDKPRILARIAVLEDCLSSLRMRVASCPE